MSKITMRFRVGEQIMRIPDHAYGDIDHIDNELGFVTKFTTDGVFCRYFRRNKLALRLELRTLANSECTPNENLIPYQFTSQEYINSICKELGYESEVR